MSKNPKVHEQQFFRNHYRELLGETAWARIHPAIQRRFSGDQSATYEGVMEDVTLSQKGYILAQICRLIGSPLAYYRGKNVPVKVKVSYDMALNGFAWDRTYDFPQGVAQVRSTKCVLERLGLVEVLSHGFGMRLKVSEEQGALVFRSCAYFWQFWGIRCQLPRWLSPGDTIVRQTAVDNTRFCFELTLAHRYFGLLAHQRGVFSPRKPQAQLCQ